MCFNSSVVLDQANIQVQLIRKFNFIGMKNLKIFFGACIIAMVLFASCGQTSSKQKELELKERELALKEKEFALKEKGLLKVDSMAQKMAIAPGKKVIDAKENAEVKLVVNPQKEGGGPGQIDFSKNSKILFWFELKSHTGKIVINGAKYVLTRYSYDGNGSYKLSGNGVIITASNCKFSDEEGDCSHGKCPKVTIALSEISTSINNVDFMDCLSFSME